MRSELQAGAAGFRTCTQRNSSWHSRLLHSTHSSHFGQNLAARYAIDSRSVEYLLNKLQTIFDRDWNNSIVCSRDSRVDGGTDLLNRAVRTDSVSFHSWSSKVPVDSASMSIILRASFLTLTRYRSTQIRKVDQDWFCDADKALTSFREAKARNQDNRYGQS